MCCDRSHTANFFVVLKLCIAAMYANFMTTLVDDTDIEPDDAFIAAPKGETLILKFRHIEATN